MHFKREKAMKIELVVEDSLRIRVGCDLLTSVLMWHRSEGADSAFLELLATHPSVSVKETVAGMDHLSVKTCGTLFACGERPVIRELLGNPSAASFFSKDQLLELARQSDLASVVADNLGTLVNADDDIARMLASHEDPGVRYAVATNAGAPRKWVQTLLDDQDPDVASAAARLVDD